MFYSEIWRNNMILMFQKWSRGYLYTFIFRYWDNFSVSRIVISIITCSVTSSLRLSKYCSLYFLKCKTIWDINYFKRTDDENYWSSQISDTNLMEISCNCIPPRTPLGLQLVIARSKFGKAVRFGIRHLIKYLSRFPCSTLVESCSRSPACNFTWKNKVVHMKKKVIDGVQCDTPQGKKF